MRSRLRQVRLRRAERYRPASWRGEGIVDRAPWSYTDGPETALWLAGRASAEGSRACEMLIRRCTPVHRTSTKCTPRGDRRRAISSDPSRAVHESGPAAVCNIATSGAACCKPRRRRCCRCRRTIDRNSTGLIGTEFEPISNRHMLQSSITAEQNLLFSPVESLFRARIGTKARPERSVSFPEGYPVVVFGG